MEKEEPVTTEMYCDVCGKSIEDGSYFYETMIEYGEIPHKRTTFDACSYECCQKEINTLRAVSLSYIEMEKVLFRKGNRYLRTPAHENCETVEVDPFGSKRMATLELIQVLSKKLSDAYKDLEKLDEKE